MARIASSICVIPLSAILSFWQKFSRLDLAASFGHEYQIVTAKMIRGHPHMIVRKRT
jgi:hypothetical protein